MGLARRHVRFSIRLLLAGCCAVGLFCGAVRMFWRAGENQRLAVARLAAHGIKVAYAERFAGQARWPQWLEDLAGRDALEPVAGVHLAEPDAATFAELEAIQPLHVALGDGPWNINDSDPLRPVGQAWLDRLPRLRRLTSVVVTAHPTCDLACLDRLPDLDEVGVDLTAPLSAGCLQELTRVRRHLHLCAIYSPQGGTLGDVFPQSMREVQILGPALSDQAVAGLARQPALEIVVLGLSRLVDVAKVRSACPGARVSVYVNLPWGRHTLPKRTGAGTALAAGDIVFWHEWEHVVTTESPVVASFLGVVKSPAGESDSEVEVLATDKYPDSP